MIALPDVNVLLALVWSNHPHHDLAHHWFQNAASDGWATCLFTQSGFLRLSLNPQIVGVSIDAVAGRQLLDGFVGHPQHRFLDSMPPLTDPSCGELTSRIRGYRQVSDVVLLHIAHQNSATLVTLDQSVGSVCPWPENILTLSTTRLPE